MSNFDLLDKGQNNTWYHQNDNDTVIVFVHGILSDSRNCWYYEDKGNSENNRYWPQIILDKRFDNPSIFLGGFFTGIDAGIYDLRNCADELFSALKRPTADGQTSPFDKDKLVFVCHSTGGIVVRYMLANNYEDFKDKAVGLVLIASPSYGSKLATTFEPIMKIANQRLGQQLKWGNWNLRDLDANFKNLIHQQRLPHLKGVEFYENRFVYRHPYLSLLPFFNHNFVVTKESAGRYFGAPRLLADTDHFSTVKPNSVNHPAHQYLVDFWLESFNELSVQFENRRGGDPTLTTSNPDQPTRQIAKGNYIAQALGDGATASVNVTNPTDKNEQ